MLLIFVVEWNRNNDNMHKIGLPKPPAQNAFCRLMALLYIKDDPKDLSSLSIWVKKDTKVLLYES